MPITSSEHDQIQRMIDAASPQQRAELKSNAEATLGQVNVLMGQKALPREEGKAAGIAIEILVRLEAAEKGGGWWFRTKRRLQLVQMYLGG